MTLKLEKAEPHLAGLTKRELFAAMALTGFAAGDEPMTEEEAARRCVVCADALLAELARPA